MGVGGSGDGGVRRSENTLCRVGTITKCLQMSNADAAQRGHMTTPSPSPPPPSPCLLFTRLPPTPEVCLSPRLTLVSSPSLSCCVKWKLSQRPGVSMVTCHSNHSQSLPRSAGARGPCGLALRLLEARTNPTGSGGGQVTQQSVGDGGGGVTPVWII